MSNNQYIPLPGGKECRPVNPFEHLINRDLPTSSAIKNHNDFEVNNPTYPLTEVMPEGEFEGTIQHRIKAGDYYLDIKKETYDDILSKKPTEKWDCELSIAIKPIKAIEPVIYQDAVNVAIDKIKANNAILDVVENKETVEEPECPVCGHPYASSTHRQECRDHAIGTPPPPDKSIEGIVGFVLEWLDKRFVVTHKDFNDSDTGIVADIKVLQSDIIKEYNNGK